MIKELNLVKYLSQFEDIKLSSLVPLIKYDPSWSLPNKYKIEEYFTKIKSNNVLIKIKRFRLLGRIYQNCSKPQTKKWYKGNSRRSGLKFIYKNKELWVVLKSNWPASNKELPLNIIIKEDWLYFIVPRDYIGCWYKYGNGRINFIIIPKKLALDNYFWEVFGILIGEKVKVRLSLTNTEPNLINHTINFFDKSGLLPKEHWLTHISLNSKDIKNNERELFKRKAILYWSKSIKIKKLGKLYWYNQYSTTLEENYGELELYFFSKSLNKIINYLILFVKENVFKKDDYVIGLLKGLLAAEGGSNQDYNGSLRTIRLASNIEEEREFYQKLFSKLRIKSKLYKNRHNIEISGMIEHLKILNLDLFSLHPKRKKLFLKRLSNNLTIRAMYILLKKPLLINDIVNVLRLDDYRNLNKNFSKLTKFGYLRREKTNKGFIYSLSKKSKPLIYPLMTDKGTKRIIFSPNPAL